MKRKIKNEIANQKNKPINPYNSVNGPDTMVDDTIIKIADLVKGRVKLEEFTYVDRTIVLDLFVNSEEVLMKIHESLFGQNLKAVINNKSR
jgi:ribosome biogenesis SPOUT family RNA methylase Rps3